MRVQRGFFESRSKARAAIEAGLVSANGFAVSKPAEPLSEDAVIEAAPAFAWVARSGLKLVAGLDAFGVDPAGQVCLDLGSSTGGFTDVLLARGAAKVFAVDVGHDQLHASLRDRPKVVSLERRARAARR